MTANAEATVTLSLIDRITGPIRRIGARIGNLTKRIGLDRVGRSVMNLGNRFKGLGDGIAATSGRLAALFGLLGAGGAGAIAAAYGLAKSASDVGAEIHDVSVKLGLGVEQLQEYRFAAKMSGVEVATFDKGVEKLGVNAVEASKGNKQLAAAFKSLGVRVKGTNGQMRPMEDILDDTMLALSKIKDPLKRNQLAFKVFGKSGVDLTKILADGASGLKELREEARRTGNVFSKEASDAADELGDNTDALKERFEGLKNFIGIQLLPVFNEAVKGITGWYDANAKLIRSAITDWAQRLGHFLKDLIDPASQVRIKFDQFATSIGNAYDNIRPFVDFLGGPWVAALGAIGMWALGPAILAVTMLSVAFGKLAVEIGRFALKSAFQGVKGIGSLFSGMANTADTAGLDAGKRYGTSFSSGLRGAVRVGLLGLGAYAASQIIGEMPTTKEAWEKRIQDNNKADAERNKAIMDNGGSAANKLLGFDFLREKDDYENSPAKKLLDGIKGMFSGSTSSSGEVSGALAINDAINARRLGIGGSTTDTLPGKAKDDAGIGAASSTMITQDSNNQTTVNHTMNTTVNIAAPAGADAAAIGVAVRRELDTLSRKAAADVASSLSD
ncbi:hypothetical protein [Rhizobium lentis]|uniref:hypothetical protein n=1 Tax=Rhizobium lentis TaxID=1138194 RepID=UPI001C83DC40|nr:hypothetical protein [Rhizobium lentis]MBX5144957.1 hypothetical protein [Rhizobium lentis]